MNFIRKASTTMALVGLLAGFSVMGSEALARERGRRHHTPPPEAYEACEGKSAGDTAEFESPRGDMVTGTCQQDGERLFLRPDHPPRGRRSDHTDD